MPQATHHWTVLIRELNSFPWQHYKEYSGPSLTLQVILTVWVPNFIALQYLICQGLNGFFSSQPYCTRPWRDYCRVEIKMYSPWLYGSLDFFSCKYVLWHYECLQRTELWMNCSASKSKGFTKKKVSFLTWMYEKWIPLLTERLLTVGSKLVVYFCNCHIVNY